MGSKGAALRRARKAAGLTQAKLGELAGIGRHAVSYWETRDAWPGRWRLPWAVERIGEVLGPFPLPDNPASNARTRAWTFSQMDRARIEADAERRLAELREREAERFSRQRIICGATTRKGHPCRLKSEPGRRRCKFHGGKSTGPRTREGRARIAEAQRRRWAEYREKKRTAFSDM